MSDSILDSIKHELGIDVGCDAFDLDVRMHINSALSTLYQIGVESARNKLVTGPDVGWLDIFEGDEDLLPMISQYILLKVRIIFDPPTSSFVLESINKTIAELEWRIQIEAEGGFEDLPETRSKKTLRTTKRGG